MNKMTNVSVGFVGSFLALTLLLQCAAAQTVHVVGDSLGWKVPQNGEPSYTNWAANNTFLVGDILTFNFATSRHDVVEVPKESYDSCSSTNPIGNIKTTGPANITLSTAGGHYYICTFPQHCQLGQKLAITVSASPISPSSPSPQPMNNGPPPPSSSAAGVFANVFLIFLSIVMGMVF